MAPEIEFDARPTPPESRYQRIVATAIARSVCSTRTRMRWPSMRRSLPSGCAGSRMRGDGRGHRYRRGKATDRNHVRGGVDAEPLLVPFGIASG